MTERTRAEDAALSAGADILDSLFHGCALRAYLEIYAQTGQFPPDTEATHQRAYQLYDEALAEKNRCEQPQGNAAPLSAKLARVAKR